MPQFKIGDQVFLTNRNIYRVTLTKRGRSYGEGALKPYQIYTVMSCYEKYPDWVMLNGSPAYYHRSQFKLLNEMETITL